MFGAEDAALERRRERRSRGRASSRAAQAGDLLGEAGGAGDRPTGRSVGEVLKDEPAQRRMQPGEAAGGSDALGLPRRRARRRPGESSTRPPRAATSPSAARSPSPPGGPAPAPGSSRAEQGCACSQPLRCWRRPARSAPALRSRRWSRRGWRRATVEPGGRRVGASQPGFIARANSIVSRTVNERYRGASRATYPTSARTFGSRRGSRPSTSIVPSVGANNPTVRPRSVDFPAPFGPARPTIPRSGIVRVQSRSAQRRR